MNESDLKRALGQLMIVGLPGGPWSSEWDRDIAELAPAGVILFRRNAPSMEVVKETTTRLQTLAADEGFGPLLICADEEGGFLSPILGLEDPAPAAMALGVAGSEDLTFRVAREAGARLRSLGLNLNLAPCVDVNDEPGNPVIGPRSFGSDPALVSTMGRRAVEGLREGGVLTAAKHFPGHGSTMLDSHKTLPVDPRSRDQVAGSAQVFGEAVAAKVDFIMTAHVAFPGHTGRDDLPATFSHEVITSMLRESLHFEGPVMSDALEMAAVSEIASPGEASRRFLDAGGDLLLFTYGDRQPGQARNELLRAVKDGTLAEDRMERSLARIAAAKSSIPPSSPPGEEGVFSEARELGISVLADPEGEIPLDLRPGESLVAFVPDPGLTEGSIHCEHLESELRSRHAGARVVQARRGEAADPGTLQPRDLAIVFTLSRGPLDPWQEGWTREICHRAQRVVLVAAFNPHALPDLDRRVARLATYDFGTHAMSALANRLFHAG
jgi:beta-N-acetylhexosaminidase